MPFAGPAKILLVDDREENLLDLEAILGGLGHDLLRATSGQQALKHLQSAHHHAKGNSGSATGQLNAAIQQLELARSHHLAQTKQTQMNGGLAGGLTKAAHHHHHSHITQAIHDAKAAEKQVSAGHHQKALHDIGKAQHQTQLAIASHHHLIGR